MTFTLPRTAVAAQVSLTEGAARGGEVYVVERVPQHEGPETVLEMLNRPEQFFAFRPGEGKHLFLISKVHTISVAVPRQASIPDPARLSAARRLSLEVLLAGGAKLRGWASAELPAPHSRLLDYLNETREAFLAIGTDTTTHYVNRTHLVYAQPLD
jgi:hypothetical protein